MRLEAVDDLLGRARSLRGLARLLSAVCIVEEVILEPLRADRESADVIVRLAEAVSSMPHAWWLDPKRRQEGFAGAREVEALDGELLGAEMFGVVAHYGLLVGLCQGPLRTYFDTVRSLVTLADGDLLPIPRRRTDTAFATTTVSPETGMFRHLLERTGFKGYQAVRELALTVRLDFTRRDDLDETTWLGDAESGRLPQVATIHPYADGDALEIGERPQRDRPTFFWVRPRRQPTGQLDETLRSVATAGIAILPELSLSDPEELERSIAADPGAYPPLVVLGSAHVERANGSGRVARANEARVLLKGRRLLTYSKIHPFRFKDRGVYSAEDLTQVRELRIACGTYTRLAVVICSDLNDHELPALLAHLMVNVCLVPSLTEDRGNFVPALQTLAGGAGQCVSVICNGTMPQIRRGDHVSPLVWVGVPSGRPDAVVEWERPPLERRAVGVVTFGALVTEVEWQASSDDG